MLKAINIKWDTDGDMEVLNDLPMEMKIPEWVGNDNEEISDYLSDKTGFCHNGFELVEIKQYLVEVTETYKHTYLVNADSETEAESIVMEKTEGCDSCGRDYYDTDYTIRESEESEDLSLYDEVDEFEE